MTTYNDYSDYTVIVGRPDHISDTPVSDTYMTSIRATTAKQAGLEALKECADVDASESENDGDTDGYVIVAVIAGKHSDIQGRTDE